MTRKVTVLADSRGLDTYFVDRRYGVAYGIDTVFAYRMDPAAFDCFLIPDHFRAGTVESNITRVALTGPQHVVLCDGIWETLLNRRKFFVEAGAIGALDPALHARDDPASIAEAGRVLTELFLNGKLSVSPAQHAATLDRIVGYFRRRRCTVHWLSLQIPSEPYCASTYHAGDYRPLPGWRDCLAAVNASARQVLDAWDGTYFDLDPIAAKVGGTERSLIDLWHFTPEMHRATADALGHSLAALPPRPRNAVLDATLAPRAVEAPKGAVAVIADGDVATARDALRKTPADRPVLFHHELETPVPFDKKDSG